MSLILGYWGGTVPLINPMKSVTMMLIKLNEEKNRQVNDNNNAEVNLKDHF